MKSIYLIGSLRNERIPKIGNALRNAGFDVFDDWYGAGPEADDRWQAYEKERGRPYSEALRGKAARTIFEFDKRNLDAADGAVLVLPAGKSGHLELGYMAGRGGHTAVLFDGEPERWDVMYQFAHEVFFSVDEMVNEWGRARMLDTMLDTPLDGDPRGTRTLTP